MPAAEEIEPCSEAKLTNGEAVSAVPAIWQAAAFQENQACFLQPALAGEIDIIHPHILRRAIIFPVEFRAGR